MFGLFVVLWLWLLMMLLFVLLMMLLFCAVINVMVLLGFLTLPDIL